MTSCNCGQEEAKNVAYRRCWVAYVFEAASECRVSQECQRNGEPSVDLVAELAKHWNCYDADELGAENYVTISNVAFFLRGQNSGFLETYYPELKIGRNDHIHKARHDHANEA